MLNAVSDPSTNQNSSSPQSSRSDVQSTRQQQSTATPAQSSSVTQDQMLQDNLRVGNTGTTVKNTTSTPSHIVYGHNYLNAAWLWLLVPIILAVFLFKPQKHAKTAGSETDIAAAPAKPAETDQNDTTTEVVGRATAVAEPDVVADAEDAADNTVETVDPPQEPDAEPAVNTEAPTASSSDAPEGEPNTPAPANKSKKSKK